MSESCDPPARKSGPIKGLKNKRIILVDYSFNASSASTDQWGFIVAMENVDEVCDGQHTYVSWKNRNII